MRVLVAGDRGYIGAVLVPFLRGAGHQVDGLDAGLYEGCDFGAGPEGIGARPTLDIRDAEAAGRTTCRPFGFRFDARRWPRRRSILRYTADPHGLPLRALPRENPHAASTSKTRPKLTIPWPVPLAPSRGGTGSYRHSLPQPNC